MAIDPNLLSRLAAFADVSSEGRARVAAHADLERLPAGSVLFREGEPAEDIYFVLEGRLSIVLRLPGRLDATVLSLGAGELTGWSALARERRASSARAVEDATVIRISGRALLDACEADHELGYRVMKRLVTELLRRVRDTRLQLVDAFGDHDA